VGPQGVAKTKSKGIEERVKDEQTGEKEEKGLARN